MAKRRAERIRRRITCELVVAGRGYRGIVLDMSETGVFVQTEATPPPGVRVQLLLHAVGGIELEMSATVARRQVAPRELASVVRGGLGLRVEAPPAGYFELLGMQAAAGTGTPTGVGAPAAARPAPPAGAREVRAPSEAPPKAAPTPPKGADRPRVAPITKAKEPAKGSPAGQATSPAPPLPAPPTPAPPAPKDAARGDRRPEYRVRVKQTQGPRSRTIKLRAASPEEARQYALRELGAGWEILSIDAD